MRLEDVKNIAIIGAGIMGHGIAQTYALGGYRVSLSDINDTILNNALNRIRTNLETSAENDFLSPDAVDDTLSRIPTTTDLGKAVGDVDFVTEAVGLSSRV